VLTEARRRGILNDKSKCDAMIRAIEGAVDWFERFKLISIRVDRVPDATQPNGFDYVVVKDPQAPLLWARFYDLKTNEPIFCSRDGIPKHTLAEISHERRRNPEGRISGLCQTVQSGQV
jgi:PelA/Pel-15E family pectate lyase